jgi:hypothetical protein
MVPTHAECWRALFKLAPGQVADLFGVIVHRLPDNRHWCVAGELPSSLLVSIDSLRRLAREREAARGGGPPAA